MSRRVLALASAVFAGTIAVTPAAQAPRPGQPPRDVPARPGAIEATESPARLSGRILAADTGRPVSLARVLLAGAGLPEGRATLTNNDGLFELADLPAGRYTLTAGKTGFITVAWGQRRPFQAGTPLQLTAGQQLTGLTLQLPRGSVISGRVIDDTGDPLPGTAVRVLRYQYAQGTRQLVPVGTAQTDDRGSYRVWGLNPGQYFVSASLPPLLGGRGARGAAATAAARGPGRATKAQDDVEQVGYAPTFYPGVPSIDEARPVTVALGAEATAIDFSVLLVRTARVSGRVTSPDGSATTAGLVSLISEQAGAALRAGPGTAYASRIDWDGSFSLAAVPPGRYLLRARSDDTVQPQFALQPFVVVGDDLTDLVVVLAPPASISGAVTFQTTQSSVPDANQVRVAAPAADGTNFGAMPLARVERDGRFTMEGIQAGERFIRAQGNLRGWMLQSVLVNGRESIDTPIDVRSGQSLSGVRLVFTDRLTEVNGTVADDRGTPSLDYTVLAFPVDEEFWRPQSRHIATARPDQNGKFQLRALPPGDYYLALIDPVEQGEWFDPAFLATQLPNAARVSVGNGETETHNFTLSSR